MLRNGLPNTLGSFPPIPRRPLCWALGHRAEGKARKTKRILMVEVAWVEVGGEGQGRPPGKAVLRGDQGNKKDPGTQRTSPGRETEQRSRGGSSSLMRGRGRR